MAKVNLSGNEAAAQAALSSGAKLIVGYPGTPSSEVIGSIWGKKYDGVTIEWSTNEKVAFEEAAACAWAGQRSIVTMKMSGLNVAYDAFISVVYSGCTGGMVVYVADDPGVSAGMPEQDIRGFALMSDVPVLEPSSVLESYTFVQYAFELSEAIQGPVIVRTVSNVSQSHALIELPEAHPIEPRKPHFVNDPLKYTKAGAKICMDQHRDLIARLAAAQVKLHEDGMHKLSLGKKGGKGIVTVGVTSAFLDESLELIKEAGADVEGVSTLKLAATLPEATEEFAALLDNCESILVLEENEPHVEKAISLQAFHEGKNVEIIGKLNGPLSRIGNYTAATCATGMAALFGVEFKQDTAAADDAESHCAARPIGVCAGCPHRGVYMGLIDAVKKLGYKKDEVIITGDIGCTILGSCPPFDCLWTEVAMGASIAMAQGFTHAEWPTPVFATIGDSTFIHAGMPPLVNAVQNQVPITVVIMDNGWTSMTGMQVNPNTAEEFQYDENRTRVDVVDIVKGLGVKQLWVVDPYDLPKMTDTLVEAAQLPGVKVIVSRRECAIQAGRRKIKYGLSVVDPEKCINCKRCINTTGCAAIVSDENGVHINPSQCNGCGICTYVCPVNAIEKKEV